MDQLTETRLFQLPECDSEHLAKSSFRHFNSKIFNVIRIFKIFEVVPLTITES